MRSSARPTLRAIVAPLAMLPIALALVAAPRARADTVYLEGGGVVRGTIVDDRGDVIRVKDASGAIQTIRREDVARIEKDRPPREEFDKRFADARRREDPDELAKLGLWAREKKLDTEAKQCFELAVKLDPFCKAAREALGFKLWDGKWVTEEEYNKLARGLVKWHEQWVTPEDREKLEQGFVRTKEGLWERPEDRARREAEEEARKAEPASKPEPRPSGAPSTPKLDPATPKRGGGGDDGEDGGGFFGPQRGAKDDAENAWYQDSTSVGDFTKCAEIESKYYKIKTNVKSEYGKKYAAMLDGYYQLFIDVFKPTSLPNRKSEVWIYASQQEFMQVTGMSQGVGGFYSSGNKRVTAFHGLFGMSGTTRTVLSHEGTHQFEDIYLGGMGFGNCPIWVIEGLAVFFESASFDGKQAHVGTVPRDRLASLKRGVQANNLIPLAELFRTPQPQFGAYHYAHAWSVIYMMLYYHQDAKARNRNLKLFDDLLTKSRTSRVSAEDVEQMLGGKDGLAKFEDEWKKWIAELPYDFDPKKNVKK